MARLQAAPPRLDGVMEWPENLRQAEQAITEVLLAQPEFQGEQKYLGSAGGSLAVVPNMVAGRLLLTVGLTSVEQATDTLERVLSTKAAPGRWICFVHNVQVAGRIDLGEGLYLIPLDALPNNSMKAQAKRFFEPRVGLSLGWFEQPETCAVCEIPPRPYCGSSDQVSHDDGGQERLISACLALAALPGVQPRPMPLWFEYDDADLDRFTISGFRWNAEFVARSWQQSIRVGDDARRIVAQFEALPAEARSAVQFALRRLNLAKQELSPGDRAIDTCIAIERLLISQDEDRFTKAFKNRASALAPKDIDGVPSNEVAADLYSLRGKVMHGASEGRSNADAKAVARGITLAEAIVRAAIAIGGFPSFKKFDAEDFPPGLLDKVKAAPLAV